MDACCGFGGKTGYIGQVMKNSGKIFALDRNFRKLEILNSEMNRLGISNVEAICMDGLLSAAALKNRSFDRVLLDAPCSGMGVIRRNPDIRWIQSPKNIKKLSRLQTLLMNSLSHLVVPGGFLVYSVCSTEPEENERVIREFLSSNPDFTLDTNAKLPGGCAMADIVAGGILKSFPHRHAMDGFFAARLRRRYRQKG
jgi:16S rRNA (cytosine967-C5)-methyltransferase